MSEFFDTKTYNISEFVKWQSSEELNLSPKFQRNTVWNDQAKSYLIDSVLRGLPIPPVFLRQTVDIQVGKIFREVIDGQQRLRSIIDYFNGKFAVRGPFAEKRYRGMTFQELPDDLKQSFLEYEIATQVVKTQPDAIIYDMFARLNTNNMVLNAQELRNARFWGLFKGLVYEIGRECKALLSEWKMFSDRDFSRMKDYELINSLVIYLLDGVRSETPTIVDDFYKKFDQDFPRIDEILERCLQLFLQVKKLYDFGYSLTYFNRPRYFYTLFVCIDTYQKIEQRWPDTDLLVQKLSALERALEDGVTVERFPNLLKIKEFHLIRTTSVKERKERVLSVYGALFG